MKLKVILLLVAGALLSLAAGFGTYRYASALEAELANARAGLRMFGETVAIPVPARDIARGEVTKPSDFRLLTLPKAYLAENVLTILPPRDETHGLIALVGLKAGTLLLHGDLARLPPSGDFGFVLSEDGRAMAIRPENLDQFRGLLTAGATVDVVWTRPTGGGTSESRMIGSALRVLSLPPAATAPPPPSDTQQEGGDALAGMILVEASRSDILHFLQAEKTGMFHILPSGERRDPAATEVIIGPGDLAMLPLVVRGGGGPNPAPTGAAPRPLDPQGTCITAIIRGGARSTVELPC